MGGLYLKGSFFFFWIRRRKQKEEIRLRGWVLIPSVNLTQFLGRGERFGKGIRKGEGRRIFQLCEAVGVDSYICQLFQTSMGRG